MNQELSATTDIPSTNAAIRVINLPKSCRELVPCTKLTGILSISPSNFPVVFGRFPSGLMLEIQRKSNVTLVGTRYYGTTKIKF